MVLRSPIQKRVDIEEPRLRNGPAPASIRRDNVLPFPDEIEQAFRSPASAPKTKDLQRPAPEARPNVSPWPSFTDLRRRAEAERAAYLRALLAQIRAAWWDPLKVAFRKRPEIFGCVILVAVFAVLFGARSWGLVGPADCRTDPISLAFGPEINATMTTPPGRACLLSIKVTSASIDQLEIISAPQHGAVTARGHTGMIYRPEREFVGNDSFAFALRNNNAARRDQPTLIRVRVSVTDRF